MKDILRRMLKREHKLNKTFSYAVGDITLSFTLRVDVKDELEDFKRMMEVAMADIDEELAK